MTKSGQDAVTFFETSGIQLLITVAVGNSNSVSEGVSVDDCN
jgi:hypothetical protein